MNYLKTATRTAGAWQMLIGYLIEIDIGHEFTKIDVIGLNDEIDENLDTTIYSYLQVLSNAGVLEKLNKRRFKLVRRLKTGVTIANIRSLLSKNADLEEIYEM